MLVLCLISINSFAVSAVFTADVTTGCAPLVVHFTNTSIGAASYHWDFGNTATSSLTNPSTSYSLPGTYVVTLTAYSSGMTDSSKAIDTIYIAPLPTVHFAATDTADCPFTAITLSNTTTGAVSYLWDFGDGHSSTSATPTNTFSAPGYYSITLKASNSAGCATTVTRSSYIHIYTPAAISYHASPDSFCSAPATVTFTNTTTGIAALSYKWSFGDGVTSTSAATSPVHTYTSHGLFPVTLLATDGHGCKDTLYTPHGVFVDSVKAAFYVQTPANDTACLYSTALFHNTSSNVSGGTYPGSIWTYGDGTLPSPNGSSTPSHTYTAAGTYTVKVHITDGYCSDSVTHPIVILPEPSAAFTTSPAAPCNLPDGITFTATPSGGSSVWYFGDGATGSGTPVSHTYTAAALDTIIVFGPDPIDTESTYKVDTVRLVYTDTHGCKDTVKHPEIIYRLGVFIRDSMDDPALGHCIPDTVYFSALAVTNVPYLVTGVAYPYAIASYAWDFGDGYTSTTAAPMHVYTTPGNFNVTLTLTTVNGCTQTVIKVETIGTHITDIATVSHTHECYGVPVSIHIESDSADSYGFTFGDGSPFYYSLYPDIDHIFGLGIDTIKLTAYYNFCPSLLFTVVDTVDSAQAILTDLFSCHPENVVTFENGSLGATSYIWLFGDGTTSILDTVTHTYPVNVTDTAMLAVYNSASGCHDTLSVQINTFSPTLILTADTTTLCGGGIVHIVPNATGPNSNFSHYAWTTSPMTGVTDTAIIFTMFHGIDYPDLFVDTFHKGGIFHDTLVVTDPNGCHDTASVTIRVAQPIDSFVLTQPNECNPLAITLTDYSYDLGGFPITTMSWSFGDSTYGSGSPISHVETDTPITRLTALYVVRELITDSIGCVFASDSMKVPDTAFRTRAFFAPLDTFMCIGFRDTLMNTSTFPSGGSASYYWSFGDGTTSTARYLGHAYSTAGNYTISLAVTDNHGCTDTIRKNVHVIKPHASFFTDSIAVCYPLRDTFFSTSTGVGPFTYMWAYGHGDTSILVQPSITYTAAGIDTIRMIVTDSFGCRDTAIGHVDIFGYSGAFTSTPDSGCAPLTVLFVAALSEVDSITWDFGDGVTASASMEDSIYHTYTAGGAWYPKLILNNGIGCSSTSTNDTIVIDSAITHITGMHDTLCSGGSATLTASGAGVGATYTWSPATGLSATTGATVTASPTVTTIYYVTGTNTHECTTTDSIVVHVGTPPITYHAQNLYLCAGSGAVILAATGGGSGATVTWSPATGLSSTTGAIISASPSVTTTYVAVITNAAGCMANDTDIVHVVPPPPAMITAPVTGLCSGGAITMADIDSSGTYTYQWYSSTTAISGAIHATYTTATTGTYEVVVTDTTHGCRDTSNSITIVTGSAPHIFAGNDTTLCQGAILLNVIGGGTGSTYSWSPTAGLTPATGPSVSALPTVTTAYTVTVTTAGGCVGKDTVTIVVPVDCAPCSVFEGLPFVTITSTTIGALATNTNYYFPNSVTATSSTPLHYVQDKMLMAPKITMNVSAGTILTMSDCHLWSCSDAMWQGIVLNSTPTATSQLYLNQYTLVEDAKIGVNISNNTVIPAGYNPANITDPTRDTVILSTNGATFNKDSVGILIGGDIPSTPPIADTVLPYRVRNTVFTSRNFSGYYIGTGSATTDNYPFQWPPTDAGSGALKKVVTLANPLQPPYNIESPVPFTGGSAYTAVPCNSGNYALAGIIAASSSKTTISGGSTIYWGLMIGDGNDTANIVNQNTYLNLYDTLQMGICAKQNNIVCYNNAFAHIFYQPGAPGGTYPGYGITAYSGTISTRYSVQLLSYTSGSSFHSITHNVFYDCMDGLYSTSYYRTTGIGSYMYSNHNIATISSITDGGQVGYYVSSGLFGQINISNNGLGNLKTGVSLNIIGTASGGSVGSVMVDTNIIDRCPGCSITGTYVTQGIYAQVPGGYGLSPTITGKVNISYNTITNVFNGIYVQGFTQQPVINKDNRITMQQYSGTTGVLPQSGIYHVMCNSDTITGNLIQGIGANVPVQNNNYLSAKLIGIRANQLGDAGAAYGYATIECNHVDSVNTGFEFGSLNPYMTWRYNFMEQNRFGYVLWKSAAVIDTQGTATDMSDNEWVGSAWSTNYQTFSDTANPLNSYLFVRNTATTYDPTNNSANPALPPYTYSPTHGFGVISTSNPVYTCSGNLYRTTSGTDGTLSTPETVLANLTPYERIATCSIDYTNNARRNNWMAQMYLWEHLQADSSIADSSLILQKFTSLAAGSRCAYLTSISNAINAGDIAAAEILIGEDIDAIIDTATDTATGAFIADDISVDHIINNYRSFYKLYIKYIDSSMSSADSMEVNTLANMCPLSDGMVIFNARALNALANGASSMYPDNCTDGADTIAARKINSKGNGNSLTNLKSAQSFKLFPNPNDGNFVIQQQVVDNTLIRVAIIDAMGRNIYDESLQFSGGIGRLKVGNIDPGLYLLELIDNNGRNFKCKFVKQ